MKIIDGKLCLHKGNSSNTKTKNAQKASTLCTISIFITKKTIVISYKNNPLIREIFKEVLLITCRKENYSKICLSLHKFHPKQRHEHDIVMILTGSREKGNFVYCFAE